MHWAINYLGMPWHSGHEGPHSFDCWGLVRYVQKQHFNLDVPSIIVDANDIRSVVKEFCTSNERLRWHAVTNMREGDCLLMSQSKEPTHVGVWIDADGGGILHAVRGIGVVFTNLSNLKHMGYNILGAYRCLQP